MGKKIDQLPVYGSYDTDKMLSDIFEVSKNSGTSGSPVYALDGSRRIKLSELASLVGLVLPGGYIPLLGQNYIVVSPGTRAQNGTRLLAAIAYAKAAEPDGDDLSASNRFSVILFPGIYDLDIEGIPALGEFVDVIGVGDAKDIIITSSNAAGTIQIANTNDYILQNITIKNSGGGGSITHNALQADNGVWKNLILYDQNTLNTIFNGDYSFINSKVDYILNGSITGSVRDSLFLDFSCGYSSDGDITISGTIENTTGGNYCFGACDGLDKNVTISGRINGVTGLDYCFGSASQDEGGGGDVTFSTVAITKDCIGGDYCFGSGGGTITIDSNFEECEGANNCFGSSGFGDCTLNINTVMISCNALIRSFCFADAVTENNGTCYKCTATTESFGDTSTTGKLIHCTRTGGFGVHSGIIEDCKFSENSGGVESLIIDEGAIVTRSRITQGGAADCIAGHSGVINAEVSYCYMNKPMENIVNTVEPAFNIGDGFIPTYFILTSPNGHRMKITVDNTETIDAEDLGF